MAILASMKFYFQIQYQRYIRKLTEMGVNPLLGTVILLIVFVLGSIYLFEKTDYASYIYATIAISMTSSLAERDRNQFLKSCFSKKKYFQIRLMENLMAVLPFIVFLLIKEEFMIGLGLVILSGMGLFAAFQKPISRSIPSPFYRFPFEFAMGFRKYFLLYPLAYFLIYKSIEVDNFNLGVFAIGFMILIQLSFYLKTENKYFVWVSSDSPKIFLMKKIAIGLSYSFLLLLPALLLMGLWFPEHYLALLGLVLLNTLLLITVILAKYAAYPNEISLPQYILFVLGVWMPPLLLVFMIYFYFQSIKKLKPILS